MSQKTFKHIFLTQILLLSISTLSCNKKDSRIQDQAQIQIDKTKATTLNESTSINKNTLETELQILQSAAWVSFTEDAMPGDIKLKVEPILLKISNDPGKYIFELDAQKGYALCMAFEKLWKWHMEEWGPDAAKVWATFLRLNPKSAYDEKAGWHHTLASRTFYGVAQLSEEEIIQNIDAYEKFSQKYPSSYYSDFSNYYTAYYYDCLSLIYAPGGYKFSIKDQISCSKNHKINKIKSQTILKKLLRSLNPAIRLSANELLEQIISINPKGPTWKIPLDTFLD